MLSTPSSHASTRRFRPHAAPVFNVWADDTARPGLPVEAALRNARAQFDAAEEAKSKKSKKKTIFEKVKDYFQ